MGDVLEKMRHQVPGRFFGFDIFLPANMTVTPLHHGIAVKAVFFFPFLQVTQAG